MSEVEGESRRFPMVEAVGQVVAVGSGAGLERQRKSAAETYVDAGSVAQADVNAAAPGGATTKKVSATASSQQAAINNALVQASLVAYFSTSFAGKTYQAHVEQAGELYTAFAEQLPGASASGGSIQSAEAALGPVIDILA